MAEGEGGEERLAEEGGRAEQDEEAALVRVDWPLSLLLQHQRGPRAQRRHSHPRELRRVEGCAWRQEDACQAAQPHLLPQRTQLQERGGVAHRTSGRQPLFPRAAHDSGQQHERRRHRQQGSPPLQAQAVRPLRHSNQGQAQEPPLPRRRRRRRPERHPEGGLPVQDGQYADGRLEEALLRTEAEPPLLLRREAQGGHHRSGRGAPGEL
mmetsp:Transcript_7167/g.30531  ORF Transcript_7167/g.30531 Transcript_7167/m.30531 type:complete len:209 (-) Transcript_7167:290-916(-)